VLAAEACPATFFPVGREIARSRPLLRRMVRDGHEIGNHSWDHARPGGHTPAALIGIWRAGIATRRAAGVSPRLFRPPYGRLTPALERAALLGRLLVVGWDVDARDWEGHDPEAITDRVLTHAWRGSIVVMHDGGGRREATVEALPGIVRGLRARGLRLVRLSELIAGS
jgi:peptidoglycan/xylan/chitin deacetylase (PgdA/CDA1 family)